MAIATRLMLLRMILVAEYCERKAPSRGPTMQLDCAGPRPSQIGRSAMNEQWNPEWSSMLRPTWSELLAMPLGFCSLAASSSRRGVSSALQAITKLRPVALWLTLLLSYQWMAVTRFCASVSIL
ncbi:hypothetical protein D3C73_1298850 [compost metagenome]